jgi:hypothetical protein
MSISIGAETDNKVLIDALKYTSDIVVSLTEKIGVQEQKILQLEQIIYELKNELKTDVQKHDRKIVDMDKNINTLKKSVNDLTNYINNNDIQSNNYDKTNEDSNVDFEILSKTVKDLSSNLNLELDLETINNTICNTTMVSDVTSFNNEDIDNFKKNKATNLVQNLIKQKLELEKKINGFVEDKSGTIGSGIQSVQTSQSNQAQTIQNTQSKQIIQTSNDNTNQTDINAIRRKKNFARRF